MTSYTCAVCVADISASEKPRFAPIGRNDAKVRLCVRCDSGRVSSRYGTTSSYRGGTGPSGPTVPETVKAMRRVMGDARYERESERIQREALQPARALTQAEVDLADFSYEGRRRTRTRANWRVGRRHGEKTRIG
jgi:hypothetical protein